MTKRPEGEFRQAALHYFQLLWLMSMLHEVLTLPLQHKTRLIGHHET